MKKYFKSIWLWFLLPVIVAILGGLGTILVQKIDIKSGFSSFFNLIINILNIDIPLWTLLIVIIALFLLDKIYETIKNNNSKQKVKLYEEYKEDIYEGVKYNWEYCDSLDGLKIINLRPICNHCGGIVIKKQEHNKYHFGEPQNYCPNCNKILKTPNLEEIDTAKVYFINKFNNKQKERMNEKNNK